MARIEYGAGHLEVDLSWGRLEGVLGPKRVPPIPDIEVEVEQSLVEPVSSKPFAEVIDRASRVGILTVDATRPSPERLLGPILKQCGEKGVVPTICIAGGRHRLMTEEEIVAHLGSEIVSRVPVLQHDPFDDGAHVELGTTARGTPIRVNRLACEVDVLVGVSFIEPSYLMGFSGGRKLVMPGISHHTAIDANHYFLTQPGARIGQLDGNPLHEDAMAFTERVSLDWVTCAVVGAGDEIVEVISGDPMEAHEEACRCCRPLYEVPRGEADVVISSTGGHPYDCDMVQGKKGMVPASEIVRDRGAIVIAAECPEGWGAESTFGEWMTSCTPEEIVERIRDRRAFSLGAHGAFLLARPIVEKEVRVIFLTGARMVRALHGTFVHATSDLDEALRLARERTGPDPSIVVLRGARRLIVPDRP